MSDAFGFVVLLSACFLCIKWFIQQVTRSNCTCHCLAHPNVDNTSLAGFNERMDE